MVNFTVKWKTLVPALGLCALVAVVTMGTLATVAAAQSSRQDWPVFGNSIAGDSASAAPTGINADNLKSLTRRQVQLDGTVDAAAIYLHGVRIKGSSHDAYFVTTSYGKTIAVDAKDGAVLWEYTPAQYASWEGTRQITNSTPVADPDREYVYAASPDGKIEKLAVADGHLVWATAVTLAPATEKLDSPLKIFRGHLIVITAGYIGDRPPYQGHVAILDAASGKLLHVWNSLCSNRPGLLQPSTCDGQQSAIWGRSGPAIDTSTGDIFVSTGNGSYNGATNWGDSLIELNPDATAMLGNYSPENNAELNRRDLDLGSTSPMLMGGGIIAQGGKDGLIRLVSIKDMAGTAAHTGHELQTVPTPGSQQLLTSLSKWTHDGKTWLFSADGGGFRSSAGGTSAWTYANGKLTPAWNNDNLGTTPLVAGGLLYIYDPHNGGLRVYNPTTGAQLANLPCGTGHWNSPTVIDGRIALPEGSANDHSNSGILDIWSLPGH
ncbi:MAG TPA: PQQ-binding-like beta-propeller repeat protein [Terriglobales bacterium]